jgi:hypothetical protein
MPRITGRVIVATLTRLRDAIGDGSTADVLSEAIRWIEAEPKQTTRARPTTPPAPSTHTETDFPSRAEMHGPILTMLSRGPLSSREIETRLATRFDVVPNGHILRSGCPPWRNHVAWALVDLGHNERGTGHIECIEKKRAPDGGMMGIYRLSR